jgi:hypothetical protein
MRQRGRNYQFSDCPLLLLPECVWRAEKCAMLTSQCSHLHMFFSILSACHSALAQEWLLWLLLCAEAAAASWK